MTARTLLGACAFILITGSVVAEAQDNSMPMNFITENEWQAYADAFIRDDGRVVDTANGDISHSEGQGYGLLLAVLAQDRAAFERIWSFTRTELMIRDDGLAAWRWDPNATPHITDINNATDGDILIAYALALAGSAWGISENLRDAAQIARTVGSSMLAPAGDLTVILPGSEGFSAAAREDGPVVNPSYWVFEAFPVLADLTPEIDWMEVHDDGLALLEMLTADGEVPADWVALGTTPPVPAEGFPPEFGYNNVRLPLYLVRADLEDTRLLERMGAIFDSNLAPARIDVTTGERLEPMDEAGYRLIGAARSCVLEGTPIPPEMQQFEVASYYGSTLQLLSLSFLRQRHNRCLTDEGSEVQR